ncbi:MAG TPA: hypothetical protein VF230_11620, partial [Acidimicrobiales bacterium]
MVNPRVAAIAPPLGLGLLFAAVTMAGLFVGGELFIDGWAMPGDFWFGARLADYVASGAVAYVYEADARYLSLPAWPIVLAPAAALAHRMGLVFYHPEMPVPRPTAWPLLGTYTAVVTSLTFVPVRKALPARGMRYLVLFGLLVYVPAAIAYGHPEDVIAVAFVVLAERARAQGNVDRAATYLGVAIGFKTAMLLAVGAFVVLVPAGRRLRALAVAAAIPLVLAAIPLAADWEHASRNLFSSGTHLDFGHRSLLFGDRGGGIDAGAFRAAGLAIALVVGATAARRATSAAATAA